MKCGIDIDGVVYLWHSSVVRYFEEFRGFEGSHNEFWDMFNTLTESTQSYYVSIPLLYNDTSPTPDVLEYLQKIAELGEIFYITSRNPELQFITQKFFDFYDLPFKENLIFEKSKANVVRLLGLDYFVDDQPKYLEEMKGITTSFLFKQPHNRDKREGYDCVGSLREVYNKIKESHD